MAIIAAYLLTALLLNTMADVSWRFRPCMPDFLKNNNYLYNLNSVCRIIFFSFFFQKAVELFSIRRLRIFLSIYVIAAGIYLSVSERFLTLSSPLHVCESFILLFFCITYLIKLIRAEQAFVAFDSYLLIISGLAIYESVNFFVYLFYQYLPDPESEFAHNIWYVPDVSFVIFCLFIARAFSTRGKLET